MDQLSRTRLLLGEEAYQSAADALLKAEEAYPQEVIPMLEQCYRELGDFKQAYLYACKGR